MTSISSKQVLRWLERCADAVAQNKDRLTLLDSAIGDGDHGANMARGFAALASQLPQFAGNDVGGIFKSTAMTLISTVGGASGPLYGTFFLQAAIPAAGKTQLGHAELHACFQSGVMGVFRRGKAALGDKTMLDALAPAIDALLPAGEDSLVLALTRALEAARRGAEATVPLVARKGRASYLGERSAGHLDPGAASSVLLFETLVLTLQAPE